ncbi:importin 13 [Verticillium dahliae]
MGESLSPSLQDVEALVLALYEPSSFHNVGHIQEQLHRLQKSSAGWRIARDLLGHTDDKIKFFGALTIMVKLNTESASLSNVDASELLQNMIRWLHASLTDGSGTMVVRKLTSALVAFFIHFPNLWPDCIRSLCVSMSSSSPWPVELTAVPPEMSTILWDVDSRKLQTVLWFAGTLVEEAGKIDANASKHLGIYEAIASNISDVVALMSHCFSAGCSQTSEGRSLQGDCIKTLQSWILFSQRLAARGDETIPSLRSLIPPVLSALSITDLFEAAAELLSDTLMNYSGFLLEAHYEALFSLLLEESARGRYQRLVDGDFDFESVQFGQLMLALGDSKVQLLIENTGDRSQDFLTRLRGLLHAEGYPISDDRIFVPALEFWSTFVETLVDCMCSDDHQAQPWVSAASSHVVEVVSGIWRKVIFPPAQDFAEWDSSDRIAFGDARKDVADLLQSSFTIIGSRLVSSFADLVLSSLASGHWLELEAAAYCLGALADCVAGDICDEPLHTVFSSPLFHTLQQTDSRLPPRTRQTCILLLERYAEFFERETASLPAALTLLFSVLPDAALAGPAAKSIQRLCSSSQQSLASESGAFLDQYSMLSTRQQIDCLASERVLGAIASVVYAIPDDQERLRYLDTLLSFVRQDVSDSLRATSSPGIEHSHRCLVEHDVSNVAEHLALKSLRCLVSIGKGFKAPVEAPIDIETERLQAHAYVGHRELLLETQSGIITMIQRLQHSFPNNGEVVETICTIFRTGFSESEAGPFVFPPDVVANYLLQQGPPTPRLGLFVSAACSFISSLGKSPGGGLDLIRSNLFSWVTRLLQQLPEPDSDIELAQSAIEFVTRLTIKCPAVFLDPGLSGSAEFFYLFALQVLDGREPLPKAAAAEFWASFFSLRNENDFVQRAAETATGQLGPLLARSLIKNIGGGGARSELDKLSEPLKKMISQHSKSRSWLGDALRDEHCVGYQVTQQDREAFLKKVISLRGSRATNQVVREFWLAARGSKFAYAS